MHVIHNLGKSDLVLTKIMNSPEVTSTPLQIISDFQNLTPYHKVNKDESCTVIHHQMHQWHENLKLPKIHLQLQ
jgi:hypothetical protein